jgi:hypothetical protein
MVDNFDVGCAVHLWLQRNEAKRKQNSSRLDAKSRATCSLQIAYQILDAKRKAKRSKNVKRAEVKKGRLLVFLSQDLVITVYDNDINTFKLFKGPVSRDFQTLFFRQTIIPWPLIHNQKYFRYHRAFAEKIFAVSHCR